MSHWAIRLLPLIGVLSWLTPALTAADKGRRPNIVIIVADDK